MRRLARKLAYYLMRYGTRGELTGNLTIRCECGVTMAGKVDVLAVIKAAGKLKEE